MSAARYLSTVHPHEEFYLISKVIASFFSQYNFDNYQHTETGEIFLPSGYVDIKTEDLNDDQFQDIVFQVWVPDLAEFQFQVMLSNGSGNFSHVSTVYNSSSVQSWLIEDYNGDGLQDLIVAANNTLFVLLNQPLSPGTFIAGNCSGYPLTYPMNSKLWSANKTSDYIPCFAYFTSDKSGVYLYPNEYKVGCRIVPLTPRYQRGSGHFIATADGFSALGTPLSYRWKVLETGYEETGDTINIDLGPGIYWLELRAQDSYGNQRTPGSHTPWPTPPTPSTVCSRRPASSS